MTPDPQLVYAQAPVWAAVPIVLVTLIVGAYVVAVLDEAIGAVTAGGSVAGSALRPLQRAAVWLRQPGGATERSDGLLWALAPAVLAAVAALAVAVIPWTPSWAVTDVRTGIVVFGAAEVIAMVAVYLHGWAANSAFSLVGGYRFVAQGLSFLLLSMFVLIGVALPAQSLSVGQAVASQAEVWNVIRQPLGLPLFLVVALGASFWGPLDLPVGRDLSGGTTAEVSGPQRLAWELARRSLLAVYALMAAAVFLGGYHGPLLPGPVWLVVKAVAVVALLVWLGHRIGRVPPDRFVSLAWTVLLPLAFLSLVQAGIEALA